MTLQVSVVQDLPFTRFRNLVFRRLVGLLGWRIGPLQGLSTQVNINIEKQTRPCSEWDSSPESVQASEDSTRPRPRGDSDRE
jgi:hypothetical protein